MWNANGLWCSAPATVSRIHGMSVSPEQMSPPPAAPHQGKQSHWPAVAIVVLLCLFAAAMYQRNSLRAHWWAARLAASQDLRTRAYYIALLTSVGDSAAGAIHRLTQDSRPEVRALAIPAMARLSKKDKLTELGGLLADPDDEVRDSAATALAFMDNNPATRILIEHARSNQTRSAASSVAALARLSSPAAVSTLCGTVASHPDPFVRAQAVESLASYIAGEPREELLAPPSSQPANDPILLLVRALQDQAPFTGRLALERQIAAVTSVVSTSPPPRPDKSTNLHLDAAPTSSSTLQRPVAEVAAHWLSTLTDHQITTAASRTAAEQAELADQYRRWMTERSRRTESRPSDSASDQANRARSADTPSDADRPN